MNILKRTDGLVEFVRSDGYVVKTLREDVTMNYYEYAKAIVIADNEGFSYRVRLNEVRSTQIAPNAASLFNGDLSQLWDILTDSFFIEKHSTIRKFGDYNNYIEVEAETQTQSTSFQTKAKLTVLDLPSGNYVISAYAEFRVSRTNRSSYVQLIQDVGTLGFVIAQTDQEPKDTTNYLPFSCMKQLTLSGNHTFDIRFRSEQNNTTTSIRRARIRLYRIN